MSGLSGDTTAEDSILQISHILFPGEDLLSIVTNKKVKSEILSKIGQAHSSHLEITKMENRLLEKVSPERNDFLPPYLSIEINITKVQSFLAVQGKVMVSLKEIADLYKVRLKPNFTISELIEPK